MLDVNQIYDLNNFLHERGVETIRLPTVGNLEGVAVKTEHGYLHFKLDYSLWASKHLPSTDIKICDLKNHEGVKRFMERYLIK